MKRALLHLFRTSVVLALAALLAPCGFGQGDLLPPPGPPGPTMKTLEQLGPRVIVNEANTPGDANHTFIISAPGAYYFARNLTGAPAKNGISIQADDVTLDLNGFALIGGGGDPARGISFSGARANCIIRNGCVRGWGGIGVDTVFSFRAVRVEKLRLSSNGGSGLRAGSESIVEDCVATYNLTGFYSSGKVQFTRCIATVNTEHGFYCEEGASIWDCTSSRNGRVGIWVTAAGSIIRCAVSRNESEGIYAGNGSTVADCTSGLNLGRGIYVVDGSTVRQCTTRGNRGSGINAQNRCVVLENVCSANGSEGIVTFGQGNRIEGNDCSANGVGFRIGPSSLFFANSAHANSTNFDLLPSTAAGPIVNMTAGGTITNTSPTANFIY
jgi:hypothetical protein